MSGKVITEAARCRGRLDRDADAFDGTMRSSTRTTLASDKARSAITGVMLAVVSITKTRSTASTLARVSSASLGEGLGWSWTVASIAAASAETCCASDRAAAALAALLGDLVLDVLKLRGVLLVRHAQLRNRCLEIEAVLVIWHQ